MYNYVLCVLLYIRKPVVANRNGEERISGHTSSNLHIQFNIHSYCSYRVHTLCICILMHYSNTKLTQWIKVYSYVNLSSRTPLVTSLAFIIFTMDYCNLLSHKIFLDYSTYESKFHTNKNADLANDIILRYSLNILI